MVKKTVSLQFIFLFLLFFGCSLGVQVKNLEKHEQQWVRINAAVKAADQNGQYLKALELAKKAYRYAKTHLGKEHRYTLTSMNKVALLYKSQGRYGEAEPLYVKALQLSEKVMGNEHPDTLTYMNNLAGLYKSQGRYGEAELLYARSFQLREKVLGKKHPHTLSSMNNLAGLYESQGQYDKAEPLYKKTLQLREKVLGKEHIGTLTSMNNLAFLYKSQGRYSEAETLHVKTVQLCKKVLGKEHPGTLTSMNNLAGLYQSQGRYGEAESLYVKTRQIREKILGKEHPDTLASVNDLAALYKSQGRCGEAESLYVKTRQIREKILGKEHPATLASMNNLAALYKSQGRYSEAESLYVETLLISEKMLGMEHPHTLASMNNLAALYKSQGRYSEAEPLYVKTLQLTEKILGKEHPHTLSTQLNYIILIINKEKNSIVLRLFRQLETRLLSRSFQELYSASTERTRRLYLKTLTRFQNSVISFAATTQNPSHQALAANIILRWNQVYAQESAYQHRNLYTNQDPLIKKVNFLRASFSRQVHHLKPEVDINDLWHQLNQTEQRIRQKTKKVKASLEVAGADIDQVVRQLPKSSVLIEYKIYRYINFKTGKPNEKRLAAVLLTPGMKSRQSVYFTDLGTVEALTQARNASRNGKSAAYDFLLGKFEERIKSAKTLYIAPDGILNLIPFAALRLPDGRHLVQRQQVNRVQTGRDFLARSKNSVSNELIAFGGVDYGEPSAPTNSENNHTVVSPKPLNTRAARQLGKLPYLKYSSHEASSIAVIFKAHCKSGTARVYKQNRATEHQLKSLKTPPRILHLATHGFFLRDEELSGWSEEAPLLLSGLAFAGANGGLKGVVDQHGDDGLLYSMEVLGLNLQGTQLVSLSACDTGKGVIDYSEGIYGLVRAFRTAGVQNVLMTIHLVGDRTSREFMETFYDTWLGADNIDPAEALHRTRLHFISHPEKRYRAPAIWAPYVMVGT